MYLCVYVSRSAFDSDTVFCSRIGKHYRSATLSLTLNQVSGQFVLIFVVFSYRHKYWFVARHSVQFSLPLGASH
ncbi:hypothetical protein BDR05DRAFT_302185 [Suillus weaverae]|nr:hypothetical protein BDR05DRAFT_302185 [Suillus weaverae]